MAIYIDRIKFRRTVGDELRKVRSYRQALHTCADAHERVRMSAWVSVADDLIAILSEEPDGKAKADYICELYGLHHRPRGSARYITARAMHQHHMSDDGLRRWRENAVFIASVLAIKHGAMDLPSDG